MRISLALFLLPLTGAAAAGLTGPFTLHAGTAAPKALQRNAASWQGSGKHAMHVPLGWWDHYAPPPAHELLAPKSGAVFDSTGKRFLHLKAPNSHGLRELDVGAVRVGFPLYSPLPPSPLPPALSLPLHPPTPPGSASGGADDGK